MTMQRLFLYYATLLCLAPRAKAARECGDGMTESSTYVWRLGDARYDGADPSQTNGSATVAVSIVPGTSTYATFFECVSEWPESWAGWYEDGSIIWSDCIWAGNGPTYDTTVSFAMDWTNHTMYISHTFDCSDISGSAALAVGSISLDMNCTTATEDSISCILQSSDAPSSLTVNTEAEPARLEPGSACIDNSDRYQSWQIEDWLRQYEMAPGSSSGYSSDTGPSFTLRNMANSDVFQCSASESQSDNTFDGSCKLGEEGDPSNTTTAVFRFDSQLDILKVTQSWSCADVAPFDATGVGYVQSTCTRQGDMLTCTSDPVWMGTKAV